MPPTQSSLKKQNGEYEPNTLHKWFFWFSPHVTYPDGIALVNNSVTNFSSFGIFNVQCLYTCVKFFLLFSLLELYLLEYSLFVLVKKLIHAIYVRIVFSVLKRA